MADRKTTLVAVDVIYGDYGNGDERVRKLKKKGYNPKVIQDEVNRLLKDSRKKSIDTLAHEVIDGLWRSGKKREKVLKACKCNYDKIQKRVNEILNPPKPQTSIQDKICAWAKKIADSGDYKYKRWKSGDVKTQQCPICKKLTGQYKGWNCIGYAWASWRHGGGLDSKCDCGVISDDTAEKMLAAKTDADALKIAQKYIGLKDIKIIRNKNGIPASSLKKGDVVLYFKGNSYFHTVLYVGNDKVAESNSGHTPNITYGKVSYHKEYGKIAIRYTGK